MPSTSQLGQFPVTKILIGINLLVYLLQLLLGPQMDPLIVSLFGLSWNGLLAGFLWQPITHMFLHGGMWHLLFNVIGLWFVGSAVEKWTGARRLLLIYFLGGIAGGLLQVFILPGSFLIGASGGVFALLLAFTTLEPEMPITALLFFVLPVRLRAKFLGWGLVGITLLLAILGLLPGFGHLAHFGGAIVGWAFALWLRRSGRYRSFMAPTSFGVTQTSNWSPTGSTSDLDRVLNKVTLHGMESLSPGERTILEQWNRTKN